MEKNISHGIHLYLKHSFEELVPKKSEETVGNTIREKFNSFLKKRGVIGQVDFMITLTYEHDTEISPTNDGCFTEISIYISTRKKQIGFNDRIIEKFSLYLRKNFNDIILDDKNIYIHTVLISKETQLEF